MHESIKRIDRVKAVLGLFLFVVFLTLSAALSMETKEWTVSTLYEHLTAKIDAIKESMDQRFEELEKRRSLQFEALDKALVIAVATQEKALLAALTTQEKAFLARDSSDEKESKSTALAIAKSESAMDKRFDSVNEFRAQLADQTRTFIPRLEAEKDVEALSKELKAVTGRLDRIEGRGQGSNELWGLIVGGGGLLLGIVGLLFGMNRKKDGGGR